MLERRTAGEQSTYKETASEVARYLSASLPSPLISLIPIFILHFIIFLIHSSIDAFKFTDAKPVDPSPTRASVTEPSRLSTLFRWAPKKVLLFPPTKLPPQVVALFPVAPWVAFMLILLPAPLTPFPTT